MPAKLQIFISYARKDGADEAEQLYNDLTRRRIGAWRDTQNLDPYQDFGGEIETAIAEASHVCVIVTPDIRRADSFVRREIAFALEEGKPIIPLVFPGGRRPITIINHTFLDFSDWEGGMALLLERLNRAGIEEISPQTQREHELAYLQEIGQRYDLWRDLYTDMAAQAHIETPKVKVKSGAAARHLDMAHDLFKNIDHSIDDSQAKTLTIASFDELREGIRQHQRVALIGDPGAGKTTTLERLAYELATTAAEDEGAPLPLFVRLGGFDGITVGAFESYLAAQFGESLTLHDYFPTRVFVLLDGLNEMQPAGSAVVEAWLKAHPQTPVIVSCRKLDYVGLKLSLQRIDVLPLDVRRIRLFIGNYLEDAEREQLFWALGGAQTAEAWAWYQREAENIEFDDFWFGADEPGYDFEPEHRHLLAVRAGLLERGDLPGMLGVVRNPFLLYITVSLFTRSGRPPANRGQLFDQFVALLMEKRGKPAAITRPPWIAETIQRRALAALAYRMQAEKLGTIIDAIKALQIVGEAVGKEADADQLLYLAASASLIERGKTVRFAHQLIQEYFAAYEMAEDMRRGVPADKYFPGERWWEAAGWEETAILLAGMRGDATEVVRWLTPVQPTLAYRCATESGSPCSASALQALYEPTPGARITPLARAEWGRILSERGDTRPGVGLRADGLPDLEWCDVPAGEYPIGGDSQAYGSLPAGTVSLAAFKIAKYPVTYRQFQSFIDAEDGYRNPQWWATLHKDGQQEQQNGPAEQYFKFWNHPRENVSWYEAMAFCHWLTDKVDRGLLPSPLGNGVKSQIRLPTEQEWEAAARGPRGLSYPWGDDYIPGYANVDETEDGTGPYYLRQTTAVGMYPQGIPWCGALDMSGNVWEWTLTEYNSNNNRNISNNNTRVVRGGSWNFNSQNARAACRNDDLNIRNRYVGLRFALSVPIT